MKKLFITSITNYLLALAILAAAGFIANQFQQMYYRYADISNFYEAESGAFVVSDICVGDKTQHTQSVRYVYGTAYGWPASVNRELYSVDIEKAVLTKVHEETAEPFIEIRDDGIVYREQAVPEGIIEGSYKWVIYITLNLNGVERSDVPPLKSNIFEVKSCG